MKLSKRKVCSVILSMIIIASSIAVPAYGAASNNSASQITAIDGNENPSFAIGGLSEKSGELPERIVEKNYNKKLAGSDNLKQKSFKIVGKSENPMGRTVVSTVQTFIGFDVYGTDQNFHVSNAGIIEFIAGSTVEDIENKIISMNFSSKYSQEDVLTAVEKHLGFAPDYEVTPKPEIILYPISGKYHYVYEVEVEASSPCYTSCTYYIDASDLSVMTVNNHIQGIDDEIPVLGSGIGQSGDSMNLKMVYNTSDRKYYLKNTVDSFKTSYGYNGGSIPNPENEISQFNPAPTVDAVFSHTDDYFDSDENTAESYWDWNVIYQKAAVDAHSNVTKVIDFFKNEPFNRNSQADNDAVNTNGFFVVEKDEDVDENINMHVLISTTGNTNQVPEAWGNKNYMSFNCVPGKDGKTISSCLDVVAHEYSHGILKFEGLTGSELETTAIHEGVGDVFGVLAEYFIENENSKDVWIIGEDILEEGQAWRRDTSNPDIKTYAAYNNNKSERAGAGLITRAASLMALGGENVNAIDYEKLANIFYDAINDGYLTNETSLKEFATYAVQAASLLYGDNSEACISTRNAFIEVGLLDKTTEPPTSLEAVSGFGIGQSGEIRPLNISKDENGTYYLKDINKKFGTFLGYPEQFSDKAKVGSLFSEPDNNFDSSDSNALQDDAVDAHYNLEKVIEFFSNAPFYRKGHDDIGSDLVLCIVDSKLPFAGAEKNYIQILAGHGINGASAAHYIDILAHEYTHVMLFASGLSDKDQESLALHEGLADVFGVLAEYYIPNDYTEDQFVWIHAREFGEGVRDCANPTIDDYDDYTNENPDSHEGGGVITKAANLMAVGGYHNEVMVNAIGYDKLARIFYKVINDGYLTNEISLKQFANYAVQAARSLYGANSEAFKSTKDAFIAVRLLDKTPENLRSMQIDDMKVKLTWDMEQGKKVGIYSKNPGTEDIPVLITSTYNSEYTIDTLDGSIDYCVAYVDYSDIRTSEYSNAVNIEKLTQNAPTNFRLTNRSGLLIQFSWNGTKGDKFALYRKRSDTNDEFVKIAETENSQITVDTLRGICDFKVAVVSSDGTRISPFSDAKTVDAYSYGPRNFELNKLTGTFSWEQDEQDTRYAVYKVKSDTSDAPQIVAETRETSLMVNKESGYDYQVAVIDLDGNRISYFSNTAR